MKPSEKIAFALMLFGFVLHTYTNVVEASHFSLGFWLWAMSPYAAGGALLWLFRQPQAAVGALILPAFMDAGTFYSVFFSPENSTAALGLLLMPLWNLVVFIPLGGGVGWWVGKRMRETALSNKTMEPTR
jgi:hypothetical protein